MYSNQQLTRATVLEQMKNAFMHGDEAGAAKILKSYEEQVEDACFDQLIKNLQPPVIQLRCVQ